jgi:hypothetical protein
MIEQRFPYQRSRWGGADPEQRRRWYEAPEGTVPADVRQRLAQVNARLRC